MRDILSSLLIMAMILCLVGCGSSPAPAEAEVEVTSDIEDEVLTELGLTEVHVVDDIENGKMRVVHAKIFDSKDMQVNITYEDDKIIYVQLTGIAEQYDNWSTRKDKLTVGTGLQGYSEVDMYADGVTYVVLNWDDKTLEKVK